MRRRYGAVNGSERFVVNISFKGLLGHCQKNCRQSRIRYHSNTIYGHNLTIAVQEIQSLQQKHILLTKQLESKEENLSELQLKKEVLEHREKKLSAKIEKLNAMLKHSEEVIDRQRSQIENLRNELIDTEAKADSLSTETYHLNSGSDC